MFLGVKNCNCKKRSFCFGRGSDIIGLCPNHAGLYTLIRQWSKVLSLLELTSTVLLNIGYTIIQSSRLHNNPKFQESHKTMDHRLHAWGNTDWCHCAPQHWVQNYPKFKWIYGKCENIFIIITCTHYSHSLTHSLTQSLIHLLVQFI